MRHSRCFTVAPKHNQFPRMRRHTLPCQVSDLLSFAERIANELDTHGRWLEMIGIRADELRRIVDQVKKAEAAWSAAKSAKASAQTRTTAADEALTAWLAKARLVVMLALGLNEAAESVHDRPDFAKVSGEPIPVIIQAHSDCQQTVAA